MEERTRRRPRIADVAREAGVSKTAVSFAFNSPDRLAPETASRIRDVADSLGYRPHPVARMLTQRQTHTIGVLTPQALSVIFSNPFFGAFSRGRRARRRAGGLRAPLHLAAPRQRSPGRWAGRRSTASSRSACPRDHPEVEQIRAAGLPLVMVDSSALPDQPFVEIDDEGGARAAAEHLLQLGHRDVLVDRRRAAVARARGWSPRASWAAGCAATSTALADRGVELAAARVRRRPGEHRGRHRRDAPGDRRTGCGRPACS